MMQIPPLIPTLARAEATDAQFRRLVYATDRTLRGLARELASDTIMVSEWQHRMLTTLAEAHAQAGYHGRQRAGDLAPFDADDARFGNLAAQEELPFLQAFAYDVMGERYRDESGKLDAERVTQRAEMYLSRLYGTANEALALVDGGLIYWVLGEPETNHCTDCPELARNSPYFPGQLPTVPRGNQTICLGGCLCSLRTESGLVGFQP